MTGDATFMTLSANPGFSQQGTTRKPTIHDRVFPVHPFAGVLAVAQEQDWTDPALFPSFTASGGAGLPTQPYCSYAEARESLQRALHHHHSLELAILSGARKSLPHLGVMGLGLMSHATLGGSLEFGMRYQLVAGSMLQLRLAQDGAEAAIVADELFDDPEMRPFLAIDHLATALNSIRQVTMAPLGVLKRVEFAFDAPSLRSGLQDLFGAPVVFGAACNRIVFDASHLGLRLNFHNTASVEISREACERELAARGLGQDSSGLRDRLFDVEGRLLPLPAVAASMGLSLRSLHRAMAREGIRYSDLHEQQGRQRAEGLLLSGMPTSAVAEALQFSDQRSFVRAFERWTGLSPAAWRKIRAA